MTEELVFGWRTAILLVPMLIMIAAAGALTQPLHNRTANRIFAALLIIMTGICSPWAIGFAGFYDAWPWLTFAPLSITLALAPLLYGYLHALITGDAPNRFWLHLLPAFLQFAFLLVSFMLPLEMKWAWSSISSTPYGIVVSFIFLIGGIYYLIIGARMLRDYREWLASNRSDDNRFAASWIGRALAIMGALIAVWLAFEIRDRIEPLGYSGLMGLYIAIAAFGVLLAFEGWRHAALPFPHFSPDQPSRLDDSSAQDNIPAEKDWSATSEEWAERIAAEKLYQDPELSMSRLARILGTNQTYLSRAFNEGLGVNFSTFINRLRSDDVAHQLSQSPNIDILGAALDAGFNSKASFNRCFKERFGTTPSGYRSQQSQKP